MTIERHAAGMLARESIPAICSQARFSSCADYQASRYRSPTADVTVQGGVIVETSVLVEQPPLGRRPARCPPRGFDLRCFRIQMGEDLLNHRWIFDAGDDLDAAAANAAGFDVDAENLLEALSSSNRGPAPNTRS